MAKAPERTSHKAGGPHSWGILTQRASSGEKWYHGHCATPHGFVAVYAEARFAVLRFIHQGREHSIHYPRGYTPRSLATLAGRFAREVVEGGACG